MAFPRGTMAFGLGLYVLVGCGGAMSSVPHDCRSKDDPECLNAPLTVPADPDLSVGRPAPPSTSLTAAIRSLRKKDPSLPRQVTFVVDKSKRRLTVMLGEREGRSYGVSLGFAPVGDKTMEGDGKTPEGEFFVGYAAPPRGTDYHRALLITYPSPKHAEEALKKGEIDKETRDKIVSAHDACKAPPQSTDLGGHIMLHGRGGGPGQGDWTLGCVAVNNRDARELHSVARPGCSKGVPHTRILIRP